MEMPQATPTVCPARPRCRPPSYVRCGHDGKLPANAARVMADCMTGSAGFGLGAANQCGAGFGARRSPVAGSFVLAPIYGLYTRRLDFLRAVRTHQQRKRRFRL